MVFTKLVVSIQDSNHLVRAEFGLDPGTILGLLIKNGVFNRVAENSLPKLSCLVDICALLSDFLALFRR